jgi:hypothetical protein
VDYGDFTDTLRKHYEPTPLRKRRKLQTLVVPPYCRSRSGKVFRLTRASEVIAPDRVRYELRATPIKPGDSADALAATREVNAELLLDKLAHGQAVPTPEATFEDLWAQLRIELDLHYA